jgi:hypothetical protein
LIFFVFFCFKQNIICTGGSVLALSSCGRMSCWFGVTDNCVVYSN